MGLRGILFRPLAIRPSVVLTSGWSAVAVVIALWAAGFDGGAMKMLLASILLPLLAFSAHLADPRGSRVSASRGALVGGLTMLVWIPWVVRQSSYERRGRPLPSSGLEAFMLAMALLLLVPFGSGVGILTAVVGGRVLRALGGLIRGPASRRAGKAGPEDAGYDPLFGEVASLAAPGNQLEPSPEDWECWDEQA